MGVRYCVPDCLIEKRARPKRPFPILLHRLSSSPQSVRLKCLCLSNSVRYQQMGIRERSKILFRFPSYSTN